jgi:hypothetical protein
MPKAHEAHPQRSEKPKRILPSLLVAMVFVLASAQRYVGFLIVLAALPLLIWMLKNIGLAIAELEHRKIHLIRISIWIVAVGIAVSVQAFWYFQASHRADQIVERIKVFKAARGHYPRQLDEIGIDKRVYQGKLAYACLADVPETPVAQASVCDPFLAFPSTFLAFDFYRYDFGDDEWRYISD